MKDARRVCIRSPSGQLYAATRVDRLGEWVPIPAKHLTTGTLVTADALRPKGIHPAIWYERFPRDVDTRHEYKLTTFLGEKFDVLGYTLKDAIREAGLRHEAVRFAEITPPWY